VLWKWSKLYTSLTTQRDNIPLHALVFFCPLLDKPHPQNPRSPEADVIVDGESLADVLIEAGMAVRYDGGKKTHKWCVGGE